MSFSKSARNSAKSNKRGTVASGINSIVNQVKGLQAAPARTSFDNLPKKKKSGPQVTRSVSLLDAAVLRLDKIMASNQQSASTRQSNQKPQSVSKFKQVS